MTDYLREVGKAASAIRFNANTSSGLTEAARVELLRIASALTELETDLLNKKEFMVSKELVDIAIQAAEACEPRIHFMDGNTMTGLEAWNSCSRIFAKQIREVLK